MVYLEWGIRIVLACVFIRAGVTKLGSLTSFASSIETYDLPISKRVSTTIAATMPFIEILIGIGFILASEPVISLVCMMTLVILLMFTSLHLFALGAGTGATCNCFGAKDSHAIGISDVFRNVLLISAVSTLSLMYLQ